MRTIMAIILGFGLILTGCSKEESVTEVEAYTAEDIPFENGKGRVTVAFEKIIQNSTIEDGAIDVIVMAKGLKPNGKYEIILGENRENGIVFGPEGNVEIRFGTMVSGTSFKPNEHGELYVSMRNPLRVINGKEVRVMILENGKEVNRTELFKVSPKSQ